MDRLIGQTLGDYRVLEPIGQGSMSRVYRALQVSLQRAVALKVFQEELLTPGEAVDRFHREAEYLAQFEHPNILPVYGAGEHEGLHWFALRLVSGGTLAEWLLTRPRVRAVWAVMRDVAGALAYLHAKGGVHRDLKPTNVLIERGVGILADFGLARLVEDSTITVSGAMIGTPAYMSPEQWRRERATAASDVFSYGIILYEALAGWHPFLDGATTTPGAGLRDLMRSNMLKGHFRPLAGLGLPAEVDEVLRGCLAVDRSARYEDARQIERALDAVKWPAEEGDGLTTRVRDVEPTVRVEARHAEPTPASVVTPRPEGAPFGKYLLRGELGKGGMGVVYRAWDPSLAREVALKVLRGGEMASDEEVMRFEREARAAARLRHPNIVSVHEVGVESSRHYFTMDLVEGRSLREVLDRDLLPLEDALKLIVQVARAVHHAHENGIIHRDLKPANILVEGKERALVGDFGLAREVSAEDGATVTGAVLGTPAYMSPEQARGEGAALDGRSDVFSLGAILYQVLTRRPPFQGDGVIAVLQQVMNEDPVSPRRLNPLVPRDLDVLCIKALERDRERRYQTAAELADDVERYLRREPIRARPPSAWYRLSRRVARNPAAWAAGGVAALMLLGVLGVWAKRGIDDRAEARRLRPGADAAWEAGKLEEAVEGYRQIAEADAADRTAADRLADGGRRLLAIRRLRGELSGPSRGSQVVTWTQILALNPLLAEARRERGICHLAGRQYEEARADLEQAILLDPTDASARIRLAELYEFVDHDPERAEEQLRLAERNDPSSWTAILSRGVHHLRRREYRDALTAFEAVVKANPEYLLVLNDIGVCFQRLGDLEGAVEMFEQLAEKMPQYPAPRANLANVKYRMRRYAEAEKDARAAMEVDPRMAWAHVVLGRILEKTGRTEEAAAEYERAIDLDPKDASTWSARGRFLVARGEGDRGLPDLEKALSLDPTEVEALAHRGLYFKEKGEPVRAEADFRAALEVGPDDATALQNYGLLLADGGHPEEGLKFLDRSVAQNPDEPLYYVNRARAYVLAGKPELAEKDYQKSISLDPKCGVAHYGLGARRLERKRWKEAAESFTAAIDAGYVAGYYNRGVCRVNLEDPRGAVADFDKTVELDDNAGRRDRAKTYAAQLRASLENR